MTILPPVGSRGLYIVLLVAVTGIIVFLLWPILPVGGPFGYYDAKRDIAQEHIKMKVGIWNAGWQKEWKDKVKNKYNIEIGGRAHSCFYGGFIGTYDTAYNALQRAEIIKRFGSDVVMEEMRLAQITARSNFNVQK
jgi:hypothetical protein